MVGNGDAKKHCFFISPIGPDGSDQRLLADKVLRHIVRKGLGDEWEVERGDEPKNPGSITPQIIASILNADLVVADLTGGNPNVYYEVAIAHGYRKPTVHIQKKGDKREFDVKDMRTVPYDLDPDEIEAAQKTLLSFAEFALSQPEKVETPLTSAEGFTAVRDSADPLVESNVLVMDAIDSLSRDVRRVLRRAASPVGTPGDTETRSNTRSLRRFLERAVASGDARPQWFDSLITPTTSGPFDSWLKHQFEELTGVTDPEEIEQVLWSRSMFERQMGNPEDDPESYEQA